MTSKSALKTYRSRLAAAAVGLGLAVAGAACSEGNTVTSPSALTPATLAGNPNAGEDTRIFDVTISPLTVMQGVATDLHVTVTRNTASGKSQQIGSLELDVPDGFTIQSVKGYPATWTHGVSGQTVRVGVNKGVDKLDGENGRTSVTFVISVTATVCDTYLFSVRVSNDTYANFFNNNWTNSGAGSSLSVTVIGCAPPVVGEPKAAPAVANEYLDSINFKGGRGDIISSVTDHMTQGARFDGIEMKDVVPYRAAVIAYVDNLLKG